MAYEKQNFEDGMVLMASYLNHIEDGIKAFDAVENAVNMLVDEAGVNVPIPMSYTPGYMSGNGLLNNSYTMVEQSATKELTTDFIPLHTDRWFEITIETDAGDSTGWLRGYVFDKDMDIIDEHLIYGETGKNTIVFTDWNIPNGVYIRLSFRSFDNAKVHAQYFKASGLTRKIPYYQDRDDTTPIITQDWVKGYVDATTGVIKNTVPDVNHCFTSSMIPVTSGKEYRVLYDVTNPKEETDETDAYYAWMCLSAYKADGTFVARYDYPITEKSDAGKYSSAITKTFVGGIAYFRVSCRYYEDATIFVGEVKTDGGAVAMGVVDHMFPSFTKSGSVVSCESIPSYPLKVTASEEATQITRCGKNLISPDAVSTLGIYNIYVWRNDGTTLPAGTYTMSVNVKCQGLYVKNFANNATLFLNYGRNTLAFTLTEPTRIWLDFYREAGFTEDNINSIQLEVSSVATSYAPYTGGVFTVGADIPALEGVNCLYADAGEITVSGMVDPMQIIDKLTNEIIALQTENAPVKAVAHRGLSSQAPENTIPAYQAAKRAGFKYVECDVQFTSDGIPVLSHDSDLTQKTSGVLSGDIETHTLAELKSAEVGAWFGPVFAGTKIPTLEEFIDYCRKANLHPYIELKTGVTEEQALVCLDVVRKYGMEDKVTWVGAYITAIAYECLDLGIAPNARYGFVNVYPADGEFDIIASMRSQGMDAFIDASNYESTYVDRAKELGIPYEVWTINTEEEILNLPPYISGVTSDILHAGRVLAASVE